jgi:integrase
MVARRSYGTGSLYVRQDGNRRETWYARWRHGSRRVNRRVGPKREKGSSEGLTRSQAERELRRLIDQETDVATRVGMGLVKAAERYINHVEMRGAKKATVQDYRSYIRTHFEPFFAGRPLDSVKTIDVENFMRLKLRQGKAPKSIRNWVGLLYATFAFAKKKGWTASNPCEAVELPAKDRSEEIHFLNAEELQALLRATKGRFSNLDRLMYLTAAMTGMRQGELVALRWRDVDWIARRVRVRQSHVRGEFGTPKSKRSRRAADAISASALRAFGSDRVRANPQSATCQRPRGERTRALGLSNQTTPRTRPRTCRRY